MNFDEMDTTKAPLAFEYEAFGYMTGHYLFISVVNGELFDLGQHPDGQEGVNLDYHLKLIAKDDVALWELFWKSLKKAKLNEWESSYENYGVLDGGGWKLKLRTLNDNVLKQISSKGSNAGPLKGDGCDVETLFDKALIRAWKKSAREAGWAGYFNG